MKVVYNACYGGFSLSHEAIMRYAELKGITFYPFVDGRDGNGASTHKVVPATPDDLKNRFIIYYRTTPEFSDGAYWSDRDIDRADPALVQVVEELGSKASGNCASLSIEDVPAGSLWRIDEYDGNERVMMQNDYDWRISS